MKRHLLSIGVLTATIAVATAWLGWWVVPLLAAAWGYAQRGESWPALTAAVSAALAWTLLLGVTALQGRVGTLADLLGDVLGLPGVMLIAAVMLFPAILAGSAAALAGIAAGIQRRER